MKSNKVWMLVLAVAAVCSVPASGADERKDAVKEKGGAVVVIDSVKPEEAESKSKLEEPNFGYEGHLGTFEVRTKTSSGHAPVGLLVVHQFPYHDKIALGHTKMKLVGARRLGNVDGWVFETEWDGKQYPSKMFFSAEKVYFGGGQSAYIAADYRSETGWVWKMLPLRRMALLNIKSAE